MPVDKAMQRETVDDDLRNGIWSALKIGLWNKWVPSGQLATKPEATKDVEFVVTRIWMTIFKLAIDTIPNFNRAHPKTSYEIVRKHFFSCSWNVVYDTIECILENIRPAWLPLLTHVLNTAFQQENAAYRVVGRHVVEITDQNEIDAVKDALEAAGPSSRTHLDTSLKLISDKKSPDYRNSIKESISAVEATCQIITGQKSTLSDCLRVIKTKRPIHPAFETALTKLYGFTGDEGGIRHALTEESIEPTYADAKFMLIACSGFCSFLLTTQAENN